MAFIPTADEVKVDVNFLLFGQQVDNTLWFKFRDGEPTLTDLMNLATAVNGYWASTFMPLLTIDLTLTGCEVTGQWDLTAPSVAQPITPVAGAITSAGLPGNVAFVITFLTGSRGRSARGRNYVSGIYEAAVVGNTILDTLANNLVAAYDGILAETSLDTDWEWGVVSHFTGGAPRAAGLHQPIIGCRYADFFVDSQRRRLTGRGT